MNGRTALLLLTLVVLASLAGGALAAQDDNRVAVVVDYGDGQTATRCVAFAEPEISGYEALSRSGLVVESEVQAGGAAVCRIDGVGCAADDCFCACRGGDACRYWSYWQQRDGSWQYATIGAGQSRVSHGAVEGWTWGLGSVTEATPPPDVTFAEVCQGEVVATADAPAANGPPVDWLSYALFALVLLLLGGLALVVRRRREGGGTP
ncbi:MAG: hypothetical protein KBG73_03275 [Candidatus Promineofilum sp.]|nr:hypothetical protein [Promineifilum sp.]